MVKEDVLVNTWKTDVTDGLIDDIIEEVKARMDKIQGQSCGCRRKPKVLVLGELEQAEENILKSFAEICTSLEEGNCDLLWQRRFPLVFWLLQPWESPDSRRHSGFLRLC